MAAPMPPRHFDYIDALRGYAVLLVMLVHISQGVPGLSPGAAQFFAQGARGVQLFFVASALTLLTSWHARSDGIARFYARRVFRIAPMFWLATVFFLLLNGTGPAYFAPNGVGAGHVAATVLFVHGWHPDTVNSVVPGGWSVAAEMGFYALFPLLAAAITGWRSALLALVGSAILAPMLQDAAWLHRAQLWTGVSDDLASTFIHLWLPTQLPVFMAGFLLYFAIRDWRKPTMPAAQAILVLSLVAGLLLTMHPGPFVFTHGAISIYGAYGACFAGFAYALSHGAGALLNNAAMRYLGRISFSAYLWHIAFQHVQNKMFGGVVHLFDGWPPAAYFLAYGGAIVGLTVIASSVTYRFVERPMIRLGNRLLHRSVATIGGVALAR